MNFPGLNLGLSLMVLPIPLPSSLRAKRWCCLCPQLLPPGQHSGKMSLYTEPLSCSHCPEIPFAHQPFTLRVWSHGVLYVQHGSNAEKAPLPMAAVTSHPSSPHSLRQTFTCFLSVNLPVGHSLCVSATCMKVSGEAREVGAGL